MGIGDSCQWLGSSGIRIAPVTKTVIMKSMLIAATTVGLVMAGLMLYNQQRNKPKNRIKDAAKDAYQTMNEGIGSVERPMHHAMG